MPDPSSAELEHDAVFVLDIGGSWIRTGVWSPRHGLTDGEKWPSPSRSNYPAALAPDLVHQLIAEIVQAVALFPGGNVSLSLGAALDHRNGTVYASAPLWGETTEEIPLMELLKAARPDLTWHILNDVTAALLAYRNAQPDRSSRKVLLVTVSTGVASRLFEPATGSIPVDASGLQGEIGHLPAAGNQLDLQCLCGQPNHVAAYASGPGIRQIADRRRKLDGESWSCSHVAEQMSLGQGFEGALARALEAGDRLAESVLAQAVAPLADVFTYALTTDPSIDQIVLTGGVIDAIGVHYREALIHRMTRRGIYYTAQHSPNWAAEKIVLALPGESSALVGAGLGSLTDPSLTGKRDYSYAG